MGNWSDDALAQLRKLWNDDVKSEDIANHLTKKFKMGKEKGLSHTAVRSMARKINLPMRSIRGRNKSKTKKEELPTVEMVTGITLPQIPQSKFFIPMPGQFQRF